MSQIHRAAATNSHLSRLISLLTSLTIFLLLGQNGDLFTLRKVQEKQHRLLSDYVCKIYIIYLEFGEHRNYCFMLFTEQLHYSLYKLSSWLYCSENVNLHI